MIGGSNVVVQAAVSQIGKPYAWAKPLSATDPDPASFDCSGLSMWCYYKAGVKLGHQTNVQYRQLKHRPLSEALPGDLVFFGTLADLYHVGIFVGNSTIIEAPDFGIPVRYRKISNSSPGIWKTVGVFPGTQSTSGSAHPVTYREYFTAVLQGIGAPATDANLRALARVSLIEGTNDRWNPLNSVVPSGGSVPFNSVGVQDYGSFDNGVRGTISLLQGAPWRNVVAALRLGNSEGGVITAFANEYASWGSHPAFGAVGSDQADQLLNTSMGNAVTKLGPAPPYDPASLKPPLTPKQRKDIIAWTLAYSLVSVHGDLQPTSQELEKDSDAQLLKTYGYYYVLYQATNKLSNDNLLGLHWPEWTKTLGRILAWFVDPHNWQRIGLFVLGAILLLVASIEFVKE